MSDTNKWKLLGKKPIFTSKWLSVEDRSYELPNGKVVDGYYHLLRPDYVLVVAVNSHDQLVLEKQYRRGVEDFVYELPAGWVEAGETPLTAAERELKEETGFIGKAKWSKEIFPQPGFSSMKANVVFVEISEQVSYSQDEDESIKYQLVDLTEIQKMISEGIIKDMGFLSALSVFKSRS